MNFDWECSCHIHPPCELCRESEDEDTDPDVAAPTEPERKIMHSDEILNELNLRKKTILDLRCKAERIDSLLRNMPDMKTTEILLRGVRDDNCLATGSAALKGVYRNGDHQVRDDALRRVWEKHGEEILRSISDELRVKANELRLRADILQSSLDETLKMIRGLEK